MELEESLRRGGDPGREAELRLKRGVASRSWTLGSLPDFRTSGERMLSRTEPGREVSTLLIGE